MNYTGMGLKGEQSLDFMQNKTLNESNANGVDIHFFEVFTEKVYTYQGQVLLSGKPFRIIRVSVLFIQHFSSAFLLFYY